MDHVVLGGVVTRGFVKRNLEFCREFTDLYCIEHSALNDLEPELKYIFSIRLYAHLITFTKAYLSCLDHISCDIDAQDFFRSGVTIRGIAETIAADKSALFFEEIRRKGIKEIFAKAKSGDKQAIYKLVLWEKTAISIKFIAEKMAVALYRGDKEFIEQLAKALKQKTYDKRKDRNKIYVEVLHFLVPIFKVKYGLNTREIWRKINDNEAGFILGSEFLREEIFNGKEVSSLDDIDYFVKFLKRNNISSK